MVEQVDYLHYCDVLDVVFVVGFVVGEIVSAVVVGSFVNGLSEPVVCRIARHPLQLYEELYYVGVRSWVQHHVQHALLLQFYHWSTSNHKNKRELKLDT